MKQSQKKAASAPTPSSKFLFEKRNYIILLAGLGLLVMGFLLMTGGHQAPDEFNTKEIYGFRNTTLSSFVVVAGFLVVLYSIFAKHPASQK